ncbi:TnsD family Tn7-like transposition protein [Herbaspirillum sp. WKF16]|uniref:TnsD family Tn7-like transposition protein n=1 Tax=Herbaspirillum sp. WKF16 TaxID=3028312 RepID=UPI0023A9FCA3|nr:TnsD family Tn7-like transposition protein [Herbaspirillum sp. WKF16]WDZ95755.1 TnsD family Tn7-like transposition protein [Herbaspirillum sp. WKF16]
MNIHPDIHVVPDLPSGEIIPAFIWRMMNFGAAYSMDGAYKALYGKRRGLDGMPSNLVALHESVGHLYKSLDEWVHEHTEYHFFCCGLPRTKFEEQLRRLKYRFKGPVRLCRLPPIFGVLEGRYRKCPECEAQQLARVGFSFIHRFMGAPFIQYCPEHRLPLAGFHSQILLFDKHCEQPATPAQVDHDVELGNRINHCMLVSAEQSGYHKEEVVTKLKASGWISDSGRLHLTEFTQRFCKRFYRTFADARLDYLTQSDKHINDALRSLLREERGIHPIWCILFVWFSESELRLATKSAVKNLRVTKTPTKEEIASQMEQHGTLTATAKAMGIDMAKLTCLCSSYMIPFNAKPKKYDAALVSAINAAYDKGMRPADVMKRFRISQTMAYRILRGRADDLNPENKAIGLRTEEAKRRWLAAIESRPGLSYTALRKLHQRVWMQLYRKAPEWLKLHRPTASVAGPRTRRRAPGELLKLFGSALNEANAQCRRSNARPVHISLYRLRSLTGISESTQRGLQRARVLQESYETRPRFINRRLNWVRNRNKNMSLKTWDLARRAGLRKQTVLEARSTKTKKQRN